jgi:hypothetical protein
MGDGKADDRRSTTPKLARDGSSDSAVYRSRPTYYDAVSRAYFAAVRRALTSDNSPAGVVEDLEKQLTSKNN